MIMELPKDEQVLVKRLRALIVECLPKAIEKDYYGEGIPYYTHHRQICFLWPASVFWGPKRTDQTQKSKGTSLGFCQGNKMSNEEGLLLKENRKQVYIMYFHSVNDIKEDQIRALLFEAGMVDDAFTKKKRPHPRPLSQGRGESLRKKK